jgi:hypothetical protein
VKRILDESHERARKILEKENDLMQRIAEALLERETLDNVEIQLLAEGKPLPPLEKLEIPGTPSNGAPLAEPIAPKPKDRNLLGEGEAAPSASPLAHALDRKRVGASAPVEGESAEGNSDGELAQEELRLEESDPGPDPR